ncbi:formate dehydrogenase accessory sulfurtransferase FdhD [Sphingobacterium sp. N143]|uniref:formate dehydrogenase accessory sulfurtransferase FdhD n=1 Tax=Sphingobacterium sp. N143 TaxID=2746727 RepID=UPI0025766E2A|nr:formate dehydrogenase accessory sulfurtransferase FdhD [Sphingobacterium sp. N143]MDM1295664.1 formate dehydrogenase accessory sulfurtransferase FdhD [Sphingobacterium sp. N143]
MISNTLANRALRQVDILKVEDQDQQQAMDSISVEEPLEIRLGTRVNGISEINNIAVTMRTPGNDAELATGFLFTEGLIRASEQVRSAQHVEAACVRNNENVILVQLADEVVAQIVSLDRNFYTTSSCGVCGKSSIAAIKTVSIFQGAPDGNNKVALEVLYQLPAKLQTAQRDFSATGGIHAAGIFDLQGVLLALREDVGRHNALDKLIGYALSADMLPLGQHILLLSGRASFELIQKAAMAGIQIIAAIGAPSSLAIDLAKEFDITLFGFVRNYRLNIYHQGRINIIGLKANKE